MGRRRACRARKPADRELRPHAPDRAPPEPECSLVRLVDRDQHGGQRLELAGQPQPAGSTPVATGDRSGQLDDRSALPRRVAADQHVLVARYSAVAPQGTAETWWNAPSHGRVGRERGGRLGGRAARRRGRRGPACRSRAGSRRRPRLAGEPGQRPAARRPARRARRTAPRAATTSAPAAASALAAPEHHRRTARCGDRSALAAAAAPPSRRPASRARPRARAGRTVGETLALRAGAADDGDAGRGSTTRCSPSASTWSSLPS